MILTENKKILTERFPELNDYINENQAALVNADYIVQESKMASSPTLSVFVEGNVHFLHSRYNPMNEAEIFIRNYAKFGESKHVVFFGLGLGYHVEQFCIQHPNIPFTIIEPEPCVFYQFLLHRSLKNFNLDMLKAIYVWGDHEQLRKQVKTLIDSISGELLYVPHPAHAKVFPKKTEQFEEVFVELSNVKKMYLQTMLYFGKLWMENSVRNIGTMLRTPNIILDKKHFFEGKPVVLVSAGPSLIDEIDNLKHIKKHKLAYIFSIGSAINSMIANDIYPDAALTYDPMENNANVFKKLKESGIKEIPLIFGTTTFYQVLEQYPGDMAHFVMKRDGISPYLLQSGNQHVVQISDAISIANVAILLAKELESSLVILVGQNLAYRGDQYYAQGIQYGGHLSIENQANKLIIVEDVYGGAVVTNQSFNYMRVEMEEVLSNIPTLKVINATKGGAKVKGAPFASLESIIQQYFVEPNMVDPNWISHDRNPSLMKERIRRFRLLINKLKEFEKIMAEIPGMIQLLEKALKVRTKEVITSRLNKFDQQWQKLQKNDYYLAVIAPMNIAQIELLAARVKDLGYRQNTQEQLSEFIDEFNKHYSLMNADHHRMISIIHAMMEQLTESESW
jgi:hypothetical protein